MSKIVRQAHYKMVLETLFGSRARLRLLKFLFRNYPNGYTVSEITKHLQEDRNIVKKEVENFIQIGLLVRGSKAGKKIIEQ